MPPSFTFASISYSRIFAMRPMADASFAFTMPIMAKTMSNRIVLSEGLSTCASLLWFSSEFSDSSFEVEPPDDCWSPRQQLEDDEVDVPLPSLSECTGGIPRGDLLSLMKVGLISLLGGPGTQTEQQPPREAGFEECHMERSASKTPSPLGSLRRTKRCFDLAGLAGSA